MVTKSIFITTKHEGFHCYPDAPQEVSYLRDMHRHIFGIRIEVEVFDEDREIEFIMFKHEVDNMLDLILGSSELTKSCESIAMYILRWVQRLYKMPNLSIPRHCKVTVDEDGENGATVEE